MTKINKHTQINQLQDHNNYGYTGAGIMLECFFLVPPIILSLYQTHTHIYTDHIHTYTVYTHTHTKAPQYKLYIRGVLILEHFTAVICTRTVHMLGFLKLILLEDL